MVVVEEKEEDEEEEEKEEMVRWTMFKNGGKEISTAGGLPMM